MDSIHDQLDEDNYDTGSTSGSVLGGIFRSNSKRSLSRPSSNPDNRLHHLENRVNRLEKQTTQSSFNGTLFGMVLVGCVFDYLSKR